MNNTIKRHWRMLQNDIEELEVKIEDLHDSLIWWQDRANASERDKKELKKRIDKAIDYIETKWIKDSYYEDIDNCLMFMDFNEFEKEDLINILQGSDKE